MNLILDWDTSMMPTRPEVARDHCMFEKHGFHAPVCQDKAEGSSPWRMATNFLRPSRRIKRDRCGVIAGKCFEFRPRFERLASDLSLPLERRSDTARRW